MPEGDDKDQMQVAESAGECGGVFQRSLGPNRAYLRLDKERCCSPTLWILPLSPYRGAHPLLARERCHGYIVARTGPFGILVSRTAAMESSLPPGDFGR